MCIPRISTRVGVLCQKNYRKCSLIEYRFKLFMQLGIATVSTFILLFLPFFPIFSSVTHSPLIPPSLLQPFIRIFPFNRGLFEDKVANFWCATNVVMKWRTLVSNSNLLVRLSSILTASAFLPSVSVTLYTAWKNRASPTSPSKDDKSSQSDSSAAPETLSNPQLLMPLLPYTLFSASLSFFLFSFQVHEKTILVPLFPLLLAMSGSISGEADDLYAWGALVNNVALFRLVACCSATLIV
jgi:alpha-1,3-glucosyltransferase